MFFLLDRSYIVFGMGNHVPSCITFSVKCFVTIKTLVWFLNGIKVSKSFLNFSSLQFLHYRDLFTNSSNEFILKYCYCITQVQYEKLVNFRSCKTGLLTTAACYNLI